MTEPGKIVPIWKLRVFALSLAGGLGLAGFLVARRYDPLLLFLRLPLGFPPAFPLGLFGAGFLIYLIAGLFHPRWAIIPYHRWNLVAAGIAWFNTLLVLSLVFFLLFLPMGWFLRLLGRDPLGSRVKGKADSYWTKREEDKRGRERYARQY